MQEELSNVVYEIHELPHVKNQPKIEHHGRCTKCLYWQELKNGFPSAEHNVRGQRGDDIGECRINSPQICNDKVQWPITYEFDWCGQFRPRAGTGGLAGGT